MRTSPSQMTTTIGEMNGKEMTAIHQGFCAPEAAKSMCLKRHMKSAASRVESIIHIQVGATAKSTTTSHTLILQQTALPAFLLIRILAPKAHEEKVESWDAE